MDRTNPGLARCPRCGAYDPWLLTDPVRIAMFDTGTVLEYHCGVCAGTWRVPVSRPVTIHDFTEGP